MAGRVIAGLGYRRVCGTAELVDLLRRAEALAGRMATAVAIPGFKADQAAPRAAAAQLGLPIMLVCSEDLAAAQAACPTRSEVSHAAVGTASVAEGCALAAGGCGARLILPRIASPGATCALAEALT